MDVVKIRTMRDAQKTNRSSRMPVGWLVLVVESWIAASVQYEYVVDG